MTALPRRVAVVGAGTAGLAAARALVAAGVDVVVLERDDVPGGRVRTLHPGGTPVDVGAQFVAPFCAGVLASVRDCGLGGALPRTALRGAVVDSRGAHPVSATALPFSDLLPVADRVRLVRLALPVLRHVRRLDPHDFRRARPLDAGSAEHLVAATAGAAAADALVGPLLRGLLYWDLPTTTQAMLLVMLRVAWRARAVHHVTGGLDRWTTALAGSLDVRTGSPAVALRPEPRGGWRVALDQGGDVVADAVVCATTATVAADLLGPVAPALERSLRTVTYSRTAVVVCRVQAGDAPASTLLFRRGWAPGLAAVTVADPGGPGRAGAPGPRGPAGALVRLFLSDAGAARTARLGDAAVGSWALDAARKAGCPFAEGADPVAVQRWPEALPRFEVGSLRRRPLPAWAPSGAPGLVLAGDYLGGPYLEGAWLSGCAAAERLLGRGQAGG